MTAAGLVIFAASFLAADENAAAQTVNVAMVAVEGRREGKSTQSFGPGLDEVRKALTGLAFDTFTKVQSAEVPCHYGEEQRILVNERYTLYVTPVSKLDDGRVRIRARITRLSRDGTTVDALDTTLQLVPGAHLNLGGLKLEQGELILVMSVK